MFQKLGTERTTRDDRRLAAYLSFVAGSVNSAGFVILGSFTSHVTGNVGRLADEVALGNGSVAALAASAVTMFFVGSLCTSMLVESAVFGRMSRTSAAVLFGEATLIATFIVSAGYGPYREGLRANEINAMLLSAAMGMQNSLVTRLSGAVVRTTHLTGVVTDLGIELARWFRYWRASARGRIGVRLTIGSRTAARPAPAKIALLATIFVAFVVGGVLGAVLAVRISSAALIPVVLLLALGGGYSLWSGRSLVPVRAQGDGTNGRGSLPD